VRLCFATVLARSSGTVRAHVDFASASRRTPSRSGQLAYYRALERGGHVRVLTDRAGLDATSNGRRRRRAGPAARRGRGDGGRRPDPRAGGRRRLGGGRDCGPSASPTTVPAATRAAPAPAAASPTSAAPCCRCSRPAGVALDLTHLSDAAFWEAIEAFDGPVHVSHGNCRALVPNQRQLSDDQIRAVAERGGVIGVALDAWMLEPGWVKGQSRRDGVGLSAWSTTSTTSALLTASTAHVGIGSDLDGGFGTEQSPEGLETVADLARLGGCWRGGVRGRGRGARRCMGTGCGGCGGRFSVASTCGVAR
jgi:membrane dipeptidase